MAAQVLVGLGVDLNRARQQVIQLVTGRAEPQDAAAIAGDLRAQLASVAARLAVIERRLKDVAAGASGPG